MSTTIHILRREDLYQRVWATPMARLAADVDVAPNVLRMQWLEAAIPLPERVLVTAPMGKGSTAAPAPAAATRRCGHHHPRYVRDLVAASERDAR